MKTTARISALVLFTWTLTLFIPNHLSSQDNFPPVTAGVHTWWHWMDGNISREGISRDLEAMHEAGIVQATILNIGLLGDRDFGVDRIEFDSPEWYEMFRWALEEANRLGISIGVHNCDGWSTSGGPWISPEMSMKEYTWTKTILNPESPGKIKLDRPLSKQDFYKDVAVFALKSKRALSSFQSARPKITMSENRTAEYLNDGCPSSSVRVRKGDEILFSFSKPFRAEKISLLPRRAFMWGDPGSFKTSYRLSSSNDGKTFSVLKEFTVKGLNKVRIEKIPPTTALYYRLEISNIGNTDSWIPVELGECELLASGESPLFFPSTEYFSEKTGSVKAADISAFSTNPGHVESFDPPEILDLSSKMDDMGVLDWKPENGNWTVIRFGFTTTGSQNAPATAAGTGLECDKMDTLALNLHFSNFPARLIEKAGEFTGNTFKFILVDSWEAGFQNWTSGMMKEFSDRRGYSLFPYLPLLCGESTGNSAVDDAVLHDFRKTIGDLIENYYYRHFSELLHQNKLEMHAEVIYGETNYSALDILKTTSYIDLPMFEFWSATDDERMVEYTPTRLNEGNMPVFAATGYGKNVTAAEAYTGMAHYSEYFAALKPFGDRAYCQGINQMILHSYVHQPTELKPGLTLGGFASHFNRNNIYWPYMAEWMAYHGRIQDILQNSVPAQDILFYLGDRLPQSFNRERITSLPFGYSYNAVNYDILKNRMEVRDGKAILNGEIAYSVLVLPTDQGMNHETLEQLAEMVKAGMILYGEKPKTMLSLFDRMENRDKFEKLANEIWGDVDGKEKYSHSYGKGKVYAGIPLAEVLEKENIKPDLNVAGEDGNNLMFIHKKNGDKEYYFIMNQQDKEARRDISFRVSGKTPLIMDPETGTAEYPGLFSIEREYTSLPMVLQPYQSIIVAFENKEPGEYVNSLLKDGKQVFPGQDTSMASEVPAIIIKDGVLSARSGADGIYSLVTNKGRNIQLNSVPGRVYEIKDYNLSLSLAPAYDANIDVSGEQKTGWLNESENPDTRYFSGMAVYRIEFDFPLKSIGKTDRLFIDPGEFGVAVKIKLNGQELGTVWKTGHAVPLYGIKKKGNILEISVANTYRNRIIGDLTEFGELKNLETSSPVKNYLSKNSILQPSGLKGPVKIIFVNEEILK